MLRFRSSFLTFLPIVIREARNNVVVHNVFDQLFNLRHNAFGGMPGMGATTRGVICRGMSGARYRPRDSELFSLHQGTLTFRFHEAAGCAQCAEIGLNCDFSIMSIILSLDFIADEENPNALEGQITFSYSYNADRKELVRSPVILRITGEWYHRVEPNEIDAFLKPHGSSFSEMEEFQHWFLFDYFLPSWHETTSVRTRFSPDDWGEFTFIER
jgi:hypothetical protein